MLSRGDTFYIGVYVDDIILAGSVCIDQEHYQSTVGSLMYLSICTRPDISFAVGNLARYLSKQTHQHWKALTMLFEEDHPLWTQIYSNSDCGECIKFSDADWAGGY